jgi:hypothetical protein
MAKRRASAVESLGIALIIFVMLTFVLAVTTYVFYAQKSDAVAAKDAADEAARTASAAKSKAESDLAKLRKILGVGEQSLEDLATERNFDEQDETKLNSFKKEIDELRAAIGQKDDRLKTIEADRDKLEQEKDKTVGDTRQRIKELDAEIKQREDKIAELEKQFAADREEHVKQAKALIDKQEEANSRAEALQNIQQAIAKGAEFVSAASRPQFEEKAEDAIARLQLLFAELESRARLIQQQNDVLGRLRVADTDLQTRILNAVPADDRIDGFDGFVISVNELEQTVLLDFPTTSGIRPGLLFFVYDPAEQRPRISDRKGTVEVVRLEGRSLVRARIRSSSTSNLILRGDAVATNLWSPVEPLEVVIVGHVQIDADSSTDEDSLAALVARAGGSVADAVGSRTSLVVDAGEPVLRAGALEARGWGPDDAARRNRQLEEAKRQGVKVLRIDAFLDLFGLEEGWLDADRLIVPGGS